MKLSLIVATTKEGLIGKGNGLPWEHLVDDMKRFRKLTTNNVVIMGRKTWESLPKQYQPLPHRRNVVLTRDKTYKAQGAIVLNSIDALIEFCSGEDAFDKNYNVKSDEYFVIGGSVLIEQLYPYFDKAYLTVIKDKYKGDVYIEENILDELLNCDDYWGVKSLSYMPNTNTTPGLDFLDLYRN